ncbi:MAG: RNA-directed DNA polymerase [Methylovulum sp.]|nr:RNA-directed DNA polymerase [Methylovulum sp.]
MNLPEPCIAIPVSLRACYKAWRKARRGKRPSANQLVFDIRWLDNLLALKEQLRAGHWQPKRTVSFIVHHPKTREIHAPYFADRIVHHLLVERLEPLFEPVFIHDSYANRTGKGSHAAVDRLQQFMRSLDGRPSGDGWYLQLDIHNFFNSIHRPTLYNLLCQRLAKVEQKGKIPPAHALALRSLCHKLLAHKVTELVRDSIAAALLPPHKRLANAPAACGIPVGNLTSQFFANVYLNELDQFVKHTLKCRYYVRYVDDFILLADSAEQLQLWQARISEFLQSHLRLRLKDEVRLQPLSQGIDFLGYRVFTPYRRVRPRVVAHCRAKLFAWERRFVRQNPQGMWIRVTAQDLSQLQAMLSSYWGHFSHANSVRLRHNLFAQFSWLAVLFTLSPNGEIGARWVLPGVTFAQQRDAMRTGEPKAKCFIQRGCRFHLFRERLPAWDYRPEQMPALLIYLRRTGIAYCVAKQTGWLRHGTRRREVCEWFFPIPH